MKTTELQAIKQRYNIVGNCEALNHVLDVALQVAPTDLSVLIVGENVRSISPSTAVRFLRALSTQSSSDM